VVVHSPGLHNANSGPDFFNGQVSIAQVLWAGNIEIHVRSSSWYKHKHQEDPAYDNVILHVVWQFDERVYRKDGSEIPTIELQHWVSATTVAAYKKLFRNAANWIPCERDFSMVDDFTLRNWMERLFIERLEHKSGRIVQELKRTQYDWEAVLFRMMSRSFGSVVNADSFYSIATSLDFSLIRKCSGSRFQLEALIFGQAGLLSEEGADAYQVALWEEYNFLQKKFRITASHVIPPKYFRLRPANFPTIRLSQLSILYYEHKRLLSEIIDANTIADLHSIFRIAASEYWEDHYKFGIAGKPMAKVLSKSFIELIMLNVVVPIKFCYSSYLGKTADDIAFRIAGTMTAELNSIIKNFERIGFTATNAIDSQALIELKKNYCDKKKCLQCALGNQFLK